MTNRSEDSVLAPYLDWPVHVYSDDYDEGRIECARQAGKGTQQPGRCRADLGEPPDSPRQLLEAVRRHVTSCFHWGVHFRLETQCLGEGGRLFWFPDPRTPSPEEVMLSGRTPDGSYWISATGHPEATEPEVDGTHMRIRVEVDPI